jgi:hypothetical protein
MGTMKKRARAIMLALGILCGGAAVDDALNDRYKDITPKELLGAAVTLVLASAGNKKRRDGEDGESK